MTFQETRTTHCPTCGHPIRDDRKSFNRWMALGLLAIHDNPNSIIHAATYLSEVCPEATRDHGIALTRHWGLLAPVDRPAWAEKHQKGSRGLSGFYSLTLPGRNFVTGQTLIHKGIIKRIGEPQFTVDESTALIDIQDALDSTLRVDAENSVIDGTTNDARG